MSVMGDREFVASDFSPEPCDMCGTVTTFVIFRKTDMSEVPCCNRCWGRMVMTVTMALEEAHTMSVKRQLIVAGLGVLLGALITYLITKGMR